MNCEEMCAVITCVYWEKGEELGPWSCQFTTSHQSCTNYCCLLSGKESFLFLWCLLAGFTCSSVICFFASVCSQRWVLIPWWSSREVPVHGRAGTVLPQVASWENNFSVVTLQNFCWWRWRWIWTSPSSPATLNFTLLPTSVAVLRDPGSSCKATK